MRRPIAARFRTRPARRHVTGLAARLAVVAGAALAAAPPAHAQQLSGLYLQNQSIGRGDAWNYYLFWPDGRLCEVMPKGGMDPLPSFAAVAQQAPQQCGRYALRGDQLTVQVGGAAPVALRLDHATASGFALSGFPTIRVPAFPRGATLSGTWGTLLIKGDDYRNEAFTFRPNGTFSFDDQPVKASGAPARHADGTYRLAGNTLEMSTGGGTQRLSVHPFPAAGDRRLAIDGNVLQPKN